MLNSPPVKDDIFGKYANGTLDLCLAESLEIEGGRNLNVSVDSSYFYAIYADLTKKISDEITGENEFTEFEKARKALLANYPDSELLGRYYDNYADYIFGIEDVIKLRSECLNFLPMISSGKADLGLRKLIYCCDEALKENLPLLFICD